ncbi:MAG: GAF domain-containing protein, partial [Chloroflexota bacterium]
MAVTVLLAYPEPSIHAPQLRYEYQWYSDSKRKAPVPTGTIISQEDAPFGSLVMEDEDVVLLYDSPDAIPQDFPMIKDILTVHDARRAAVTPLWSRQRWLGVMLISTKKRNILNEDDRRFIQSIGDQLAIGIENQTLLAESQFERQRLQNILETLPVGVMVLDPDTLIPISANQQVEELLGQPLNMEEPFTAERYHIRRTGTNLEYPTNELPMYKAREQGKRIRPADDLAIITEFDRTDLLISAAPIFDPSGESRAIVVSLSDVTPMRSMENTMQENLRETVLLYETQRAMNESEDLEQLLDSLVAQMVMQQPTDTYIVLQNEGKIELARVLLHRVF